MSVVSVSQRTLKVYFLMIIYDCSKYHKSKLYSLIKRLIVTRSEYERDVDDIFNDISHLYTITYRLIIAVILLSLIAGWLLLERLF